VINKNLLDDNFSQFLFLETTKGILIVSHDMFNFCIFLKTIVLGLTSICKMYTTRKKYLLNYPKDKISLLLSMCCQHSKCIMKIITFSFHSSCMRKILPWYLLLESPHGSSSSRNFCNIFRFGVLVRIHSNLKWF
jgi:hypothetical protein